MTVSFLFVDICGYSHFMNILFTDFFISLRDLK